MLREKGAETVREEEDERKRIAKKGGSSITSFVKNKTKNNNSCIAADHAPKDSSRQSKSYGSHDAPQNMAILPKTRTSSVAHKEPIKATKTTRARTS